MYTKQIILLSLRREGHMGSDSFHQPYTHLLMVLISSNFHPLFVTIIYRYIRPNQAWCNVVYNSGEAIFD